MPKLTLDSDLPITFVGHFDIGERLGDDLQRLVLAAQNIPGKKVILVGDIGVYDKLYAFIRKGLAGVVLHYHYRQYCAETECLLAQLPKSEADILDIFDQEQYDFMASYIQKSYPEVYFSIKNKIEKDARVLQNCDLNKLIESIVEQRLKRYNFVPEEVIIVSERYLRNMVGRRIKPQGEKSWTKLHAFTKNNLGIKIGDELIASGNNNPLCRGIMFAFNEYISEQGYTSVNYLLEDRQQGFVKKGWDLFDMYRNELNHLKSTVKGIQITTMKKR